MIDLVRLHLPEIAQVCTTHRVARLDVFGSATRSDYRTGESDLDLLVAFQSMPPRELADAYYGLLEDLRTVLGVPIDLVMRDAVKNRYVAAAIERERQPVYP